MAAATSKQPAFIERAIKLCQNHKDGNKLTDREDENLRNNLRKLVEYITERSRTISPEDTYMSILRMLNKDGASYNPHIFSTLTTADQIDCNSIISANLQRDHIKQIEQEIKERRDIPLAKAPTTTAVKCAKCGATEIEYRVVQRRSSDEPPTKYYTCTNINCKATWRVD
jgi:DNA-directed RNA polymerase subunit M/transcription elongation factor TFIIS